MATVMVTVVVTVMVMVTVVTRMGMETVVLMAMDPFHHLHQTDVAEEISNPSQYQALLRNQTHHKSFQEPPELCT